LCFDDGSGDAQQRFLTEDGRALWNGPDFAREAEGFQVVEESVADVSERRMPTKEADVLGLETHLFQEVEGLIESGGKEIAALRRQRTHEEFEARGGAEAVLKIGCRHGELVKVREQGRMAQSFGHEGASGEIIEDRRAVIMRPYDLAFLILGGSQGLRERSPTVHIRPAWYLIDASDLGRKKTTCIDGRRECD